jgi:hypothetical protein
MFNIDYDVRTKRAGCVCFVSRVRSNISSKTLNSLFGLLLSRIRYMASETDVRTETNRATVWMNDIGRNRIHPSFIRKLLFSTIASNGCKIVDARS